MAVNNLCFNILNMLPIITNFVEYFGNSMLKKQVSALGSDLSGYYEA